MGCILFDNPIQSVYNVNIDIYNAITGGFFSIVIKYI